MQMELKANPLDFRMGVSLGDVIDDGEDIHGEGVNIAARIEALADSGGICISGGVYDQVRNRLDHRFEDMGEHEVKHVSAPVRVYRIVLAISTSGMVETGSPDLALPDEPSIAVLPFDNMSNDPDQEYFSDGFTEDLITDLSKLSGLVVIARTSSFTYKGQSPDVRQVARDLAVKYVLEGSVRKAGDQLRISAQLIDGTTGAHLWAERYDGNLNDIFQFQDLITEKIVGAIAVSLTRAEQKRALQEPTDNMGAYDYVLRGSHYHYEFEKKDNAKAKEMFERAIELDSDYAEAYAGLGWAHIHDFNLGWSDDPDQSLRLALEYSTKAVSLDRSSAKAHMVLADVYLWTGRIDDAFTEGKRSIELNPSYADAHMMFCWFAG